MKTALEIFREACDCIDDDWLSSSVEEGAKIIARAIAAARLAGRREAIEECAKVATDRAQEICDEHIGLMSNHATYDASIIAHRIRAIAEREPEKE